MRGVCRAKNKLCYQISLCNSSRPFLRSDCERGTSWPSSISYQDYSWEADSQIDEPLQRSIVDIIGFDYAESVTERTTFLIQHGSPRWLQTNNRKFARDAFRRYPWISSGETQVDISVVPLTCLQIVIFITKSLVVDRLQDDRSQMNNHSSS